LTDFQKFFIGILSGILLAVLVIVGILFFTKTNSANSKTSDTEMTAKIEAEKDELARLEERRAKIEAEIEKAKREGEKELALLETERLKQAEELNKNLTANSTSAEKEKQAAEAEKKKKAEEALKRAEEAKKRQEELIKQQKSLKEAEAKKKEDIEKIEKEKLEADRKAKLAAEQKAKDDAKKLEEARKKAALDAQKAAEAEKQRLEEERKKAAIDAQKAAEAQKAAKENTDARLRAQLEEAARLISDGITFLQNGNLNSALTSFSKASAILPDSEVAHNAKSFLDMASSLNDFSLKKADSADAEKAISAADEYIRKSVNLDGQNAKSHYVYSQIADAQKKSQVALVELEKAQSLDPDNYVYNYELGKKYYAGIIKKHVIVLSEV